MISIPMYGTVCRIARVTVGLYPATYLLERAQLNVATQVSFQHILQPLELRKEKEFLC